MVMIDNSGTIHKMRYADDGVLMVKDLVVMVDDCDYMAFQAQDGSIVATFRRLI